MDAKDTGQRLLSSVNQERDQAGRDMGRALVLAAPATLDSMATSVATILSAGQWRPDSFIEPVFGDYYGDVKDQGAAIGGVASLFLGGGYLQGVGRIGGAADRLSKVTRLDKAADFAVNRGVIGGINRAFPKANVQPLNREHVFSTMQRVYDRDNMVAAARYEAQLAGASMFKNNMPAFDISQEVGSRFGAAPGTTFGQLQRANNVDRAVQAVKESLWAEATIFALYNNNEFLFPDEASTWDYLLAGGLGVGLGTSLEWFAGRSVAKKAMAEAGRKANNEMAIRRVGSTAEDMPWKNVVGEHWMGATVALRNLDRADEMEAQASSLAAGTKGLLTPQHLMAEAERFRSANKRALTEATRSMAMEAPAIPVLRGKALSGLPAIGRKSGVTAKELVAPAVERFQINPRAADFLAEITDHQAVGRYSTTREVLTDRINIQLRALGQAADSKEVASITRTLNTLQDARAELNQFSVGTLERTGAVNYDPARRLPHWAVHRGPSIDFDRRSGQTRLKQGSANVQNLRMNQLGQLRRVERGKLGQTVREITQRELDFDDVTALQTMVARLAADQPKWSEDFWESFLRTPALQLEDLPFPLLDAIATGLVPNNSQHPAGQRINAMVQDGRLMNMALASKLDWLKDNWQKSDGPILEELSLFDMEKAVNLRLTDNLGRPNGLGYAVRSYLEQNGVSAKEILTTARANEGLDNFRAMGIGRATPNTDTEMELLSSSFDEGIRGVGNMSKNSEGRMNLDQEDGIGVIYHNVSEPTDSESQIAKLAWNRKATRMAEFLDTQNTTIRALNEAMLQQQVADKGARAVGTLFYDPTVKNNRLTTATFAHRNQPAIQHAHQLGQSFQRAIDAVKVERITPIADQFRDIVRGNDVITQAEISNVRHFLGRGIGLEAETYMPGRNLINVQRDDVFKRIEENFGTLQGAPARTDPWELFDVNVALREGRYVPIELSDKSANLLNEMVDVNYHILEGINAVRRFQGRAPINQLNGHIQTTDFSRYAMRYVKDLDSEKVIGFVRARTEQEADREVTRILQDYNARNPGARAGLTSAEDIAQYYDAMDMPFHYNLRDMSGYGQTGATRGRLMDMRLDVSGDMLSEILEGMTQSLDDLKNRSVGVLYSDSIYEAQQIARRMGISADPRGKTFNNPVDVWMNMLSASRNIARDGHAAKAHHWLETTANAVIGKVAETFPRPMELVDAILNHPGSGIVKGATAAERHRADEIINNYQPWNGVLSNEEVSNLLKVRGESDPYKLARTLQSANRLTAGLLLKHSNIAHPILNVLGVTATMPSVIARVQPKTGESLEAWRARVGAISDYFDDVDKVATISPAKLAAEGIHLAMKDKAAYEFAQKRGYLQGNLIEELDKAMGLAPAKFTESVEKFMKMTDVLNHWMRRPAAKKLGIPLQHETFSEGSETMTRAWAHMSGVALGRRSGMSEEQAHAFGHYIANQNIADFAPNIRGEAFQGLAGIPFGLFQSFGINILQRLFTYVESKDARALAYSAIMQGSLFGVQSFPGWPALNELYFKGEDTKPDERGATSLNERIYANFGKFTGDLLMTGTPSNLTKLFSDTGINLYTSADINPRLPTIPPAIGVLAQTAKGLQLSMKAAAVETPKLFNGDVDADWMRVPEVMANYLPVRSARGVLDLMMGERIDRNGNLVNENTRNAVGIVSRLIGTRTTNELQTSAALWDNQQAQAQRIAKMGEVRSEMLRHLRNGDMREEELQHYLAKYMLAGGREDQWPRWLNFTAEKARNTKEERALDKLVSKTGEVMPHDLAAVNRLYNSGTDLGTVEEPAAE